MLNTMLILIQKNGTFKAGDHVQISKHRNVFPKEYTPNWSKVFFSYWQN